jgi:hypothetical protein
MITSHNSIGALALGNGEVDSSILSGSTSFSIDRSMGGGLSASRKCSIFVP